MVIFTIAQHTRLRRYQIPWRTKRDIQQSASLSSSTSPNSHISHLNANELIDQVSTPLYCAPSTMPLVVPWLEPGTIEAADAANKSIPSKRSEPRQIIRHITVVDERTDKKRPVNEKCVIRLPITPLFLLRMASRTKEYIALKGSTRAPCREICPRPLIDAKRLR